MHIKINSPIVLIYLIVCLIIFGGTNYFDYIPKEYLITDPFFKVDSLQNYISIIGSSFGHANLDHLIGNLSFILLIGPLIEEKYGSRKFFFITISTVILLGVVSTFLFRQSIWGASGFVFMLIILSSFTNVRSKTIPLTFIITCILFVGKEIIQSNNLSNTSIEAHLVGALIGAFIGFTIKPLEKEKKPLTLDDDGITPSS